VIILDEMKSCFEIAERKFEFLLSRGFCLPIKNSGGLWGSLLYRGDKITVSIEFELREFFIYLTVCPAGKEKYLSIFHLINILRTLGLDDDYQSKTRNLGGKLDRCGEFLDIYVFALQKNLDKIIDNSDLIFEGK